VTEETRRNSAPLLGWRWLVEASGPRYKSGDALDKEAEAAYADRPSA